MSFGKDSKTFVSMNQMPYLFTLSGIKLFLVFQILEYEGEQVNNINALDTCLMPS